MRSSGASVERFVAEGARVLAADIQDEAGRALADRFPGWVHFARCNVSDPAQIRAAIEQAVAVFGGLDILFSNAGRGGSPAGVQNFDATGWDETQALLLRSVAAGAAYATPHMIRRGGGSIINTSSVSALQAGYAPLAYSVAKAGVLHYTRLAAAELSAHRIRINAIVPGFIATSIFGGMFGMGAEQSAQLAQQVVQLVVVVGEGVYERGAVDHHQPERHQDADHRQQRVVRFALGRVEHNNL